MITIKKYAAIDIGSNAMRLLVANIIEEDGKETHFSKSALVRVPIRLGQDAFTVGEISEELHKENPDTGIIERATEDVKEEIGDSLE